MRFAFPSLPCALLLVLSQLQALATNQMIELSEAEALEIGNKIWKNECAGTIKGLTTWNKGEEFPSLGICHFIWYPEGKEYKFEESFPAFLEYAQGNGAKLPDWLAKDPGQMDSPWTSRSQFYSEFDTPRMKELRQFLADNVKLQAHFATWRAEQALPKLLAATPEDKQEEVTMKFYKMAESGGGVYALIDYVNFKGEGTNPKERYNGQGWGLLQVLELAPIKENQTPDQALAAFRKGATAALARRVKNSPPERGEKRWLAGWGNRIATYKN